MKRFLCVMVLLVMTSVAQAQAIRGVYSSGYETQAAATLIERVVPPKARCKTRITKLQYRCGATVHTLTCMKPLGTTTLSAAAASGQAVINITANPGTGTVAGVIAANDYLVLRKKTTGVVYFHKVSSVSTLAITLTANLAVALVAGDDVWFYGIPTNVATTVASGHMPLESTASAIATYTGSTSNEGIFTTDGNDQPVIITSDNATAAGFLQLVTAMYVDENPGVR